MNGTGSARPEPRAIVEASTCSSAAARVEIDVGARSRSPCAATGAGCSARSACACATARSTTSSSQLTEGVIAHEELGDPVDAAEVRRPASSHARRRHAAGSRPASGATAWSSPWTREQPPSSAERPVRRLALAWPGHPEQRFTGLGARHGTHVDQAGRTVQLGADRRYTGPDCPPDMLEHRRDPAGRLRAGAVAARPRAAGRRGSRPTADGAQLRRSATRSSSPRARPPGRCACTCSARRRPPRACAHYLRATDALPALLPEWAYGHWKSRDVYEHQRDVEADFEGYLRAPPAARRDRARLAVGDAIQHVGVQPAPVPGRARADRRACARTACARWCGSRRGSTSTPATASARPTPSPSACTASRRPTTPRAPRRALRARRRRRAVRRALVDGHRLAGRLHLAGRRGVVARAGQARAARWASQGIKADDGEGFYFPDDVRFADGRTGAEAAWGHGPALPALDAARARRGPPRRAACCSAARAGPASRRSASPGAATSRRTSGRCARSSRRR